ncbi:unnamed protein product [Symbiodinium necroappetens]|uniref:Uncharacterized protein n=1 Tax=Symbiodinium necroappetens TaxID=1628268 RepID=A0A812TBU7_9DINO|nr:unnamed protein product [Symbiodinium necroappetens]
MAVKEEPKTIAQQLEEARELLKNLEKLHDMEQVTPPPHEQSSGVVRDVGEDAQPSFPSDELPTPFKSTQKETPLKAATAPAKPKQTPRKSLLETFESVSDVPPETMVLTIPAAQPDLSSESGDEILRYAMQKNLVEVSSGEEEKDDYVGTPLKDTKAEPDLSADDTQDDASSDENEDVKPKAGGKTLAKLTKSEEAKLEAVLRRLCKADRRGNYQVPEQVHKLWKKGGSSRKDKYQKKLLWYWCDIAYEGTKASKDEEELIRDTSLCDGARVSEDIDGVPTMLDEKVANLQNRIAELSQKHDELADMKSAYDCDETIDTVKLSKLINTVNKMASRLTMEENKVKKIGSQTVRAAAQGCDFDPGPARYMFAEHATGRYFVDKISGQQHLEGHPCIMFSDFLATLADMDKMEILTAGADLRSFWDKMQPLKPHHPVYKLSAEDRAFTIPIYLIGDEGRGYKKSAVFVLGSEPVLGSGCEAEDERTAAEPLRMNFRGNSIVTRQLYSVMPRTTYLKDSTPLHKLVSAWAEDLAKCFTTGLEVTLWDFGVTGAAATGIDKNLSHLYDEMKVFEKKNKLYLHMNALTKGLLAISSSADFPYGAWFKGADTTFVMKFLIFKFQNVLEEHDFQDSEVRLYFEQILACLKAFDSFLSMLYKAGLFLELPRLAKIFRCGRTMVQLYAKIATLAYGRHLPRFKLNPKYHMLLHVLLDLKFATESNRQALNPISHSCQMAEDFINRIATLGRSVKANKVPERTLYLYKVELARCW